MYTYFQTLPAAAVIPMFDGHAYARTRMELYGLADGRIHVRPTLNFRLMRVTGVKDGVAYAPVGRAGDAIACTVNLPFGVVASHERSSFNH